MKRRKCAGACGRTLARSKFSKTQWRKRPRYSRCSDCIKFHRIKTSSGTSSRNSNSPQVDINDRVFVHIPYNNRRKLAVVVGTTTRRVDVIFDSNCRRRVSTIRRTSIMSPTSKDNANTLLSGVAASEDSTASDLSLVSCTHGRNRRAERAITKQDLKRAIKHGRKERTRPGQDGRPR